MNKEDFVEAFTTVKRKDLTEMYQKSPQAIWNGIKRMVERTNHPEWVYEQDGEQWISAEGVAWLDNYFQKPASLSTNVELIQANARADKFEALYNEQNKRIEDMKQAFNDRLQDRLDIQKAQLQLESKEHQDEQEKRIKELEEENERLKKRNLWDYIFKK